LRDRKGAGKTQKRGKDANAYGNEWYAYGNDGKWLGRMENRRKRCGKVGKSMGSRRKVNRGDGISKGCMWDVGEGSRKVRNVIIGNFRG
jgi:hypothetical protein